MPIEHVRVGPGLRTSVWDAQRSALLAQTMLSQITKRIHVDGLNAAGALMGRYSQTPIALDFRHPTAMRLKPKGGRPMYGNPAKPYQGNPMRAYIWAEGRDPRSAGRRAKAKRGGKESLAPLAIVGRMYDQGYAEYKANSQKGGADRVRLVLSGEMLRSWHVKEMTADRIVIGLTGGAAVYGTYLEQRYHFMGLAPQDRAVLASAVAVLIGTSDAAVIRSLTHQIEGQARRLLRDGGQ